jgi:hypothetical protein
MSRFNFRVEHPYAARLISVRKRPIENDPRLSLSLLRLEFEIFWKMQGNVASLRSQGEIACRDLLIGELIPVQNDSGQLVYASALKVKGRIQDPQRWTASLAQAPWVEIIFGEADPIDGRNPFKSIRAFDPSGWKIEKYRYDRSAQWVSVSDAAAAVCASASTVRRRVDELEAEFGARVIRRTRGNQRRIYLPLFLNAWSDEA